MRSFAHRSPSRACLACTLLVLALVAAHPYAARADADPASDVLLVQNAFFPYQPPVSGKLETAMNGALSAAGRAWLPLKVAIIDSPEDLGAVPEFFGHPQPYAEFLDREISYNYAQPLLVVMPDGYGVAAAPSSALAGVPVDAKHGSYGLTRSAILAVVAMARAAGHPIATPAIPANAASSGGGVPVALLFGIPAAILIVAGILLMRGGRERDLPPLEPPAGFFDPPRG